MKIGLRIIFGGGGGGGGGGALNTCGMVSSENLLLRLQPVKPGLHTLQVWCPRPGSTDQEEEAEDGKKQEQCEGDCH